jgi:ketosteroid isomerase-like protein
MPLKNRVSLQRLYEALETRDFSTFFSLLSPEIRITQSPGVPWGGAFRGHDGVKVFLERMAAQVNSYVAIERILDAGESMAVTGRTYGATRRSGRRFDVPTVHLWEFKDGLATRLEIALDLPAFKMVLADGA